MLGACYLTEWTAGLEYLFELGEEVETYLGPSEMVEKINDLKANAALRREMRTKAQRRALAEHSVPRSMKRILEKLGIGTTP